MVAVAVLIPACPRVLLRQPPVYILVFELAVVHCSFL